MSSTKRGSIRLKDDIYETPSWVTQLLLKYEKFEDPILEPAVGRGFMKTVLEDEYYVIGLDINPDFKPDIIADYLSWTPNRLFKSIVTNPPYIYAMEYIEKSLSILQNTGKLALLLRLNFLESVSRYNFWKHNMPNRLYVLSERPSFIGTVSTDSIAYAWYIWEKGLHTPCIIRVISKEELNE